MIKIGDRIDARYRITSRIGTGGMAEVFEANDFILKRIVALKIMKEELLSDPKNIERFEHEAKSCAQMNHPNIIHVFSTGMVEGRPFMAYEYIKGQTLGQKLDFLTLFSVQEACTIMTELLDAVQYIHEQGIIHRDIKPQNIFYMPDGTIKLADFGIAVDADLNDTKTEQGIMGSVYYLAPEISQGKAPTVASDIYSLGVTFFELVTGRLPFEGTHAVDIAVAHIKKNFPTPSKINPSIPQVVDKIILKACTKNPINRYKTANEMIAAIKDAMSNNDNFKEKKGLLRRLFGLK